MKAVCNCKNNSENDLVIVIRKERLSFFEKWSGGDWFGFWILALLTGGVWFLFVFGYYSGYILDPPSACQFCDEEIPNENLR